MTIPTLYTGREPGGNTGLRTDGGRAIPLICGTGHVRVRCVATGVRWATSARYSWPCCESRTGKVSRNCSMLRGEAYDGVDGESRSSTRAAI